MAPVAGFLHGLSTAKLATLADVYSPGVTFHSPLEHARGLPGLRRAYEQQFVRFTGLQLTVTDVHGDEHSGFLAWTLDYQVHGNAHVITGISHVQFAADGRIARQYDCWDASLPVYGKIPGLGWLLRRVQRRLIRSN